MGDKEMKNKAIALSITLLLLLTAGVSFAASSGYSLDPTIIGVGARSIGLGRSGVALISGADSIFINPAALAQFKTPKATTMYTNLMGDVNYTLLGGTYPLEIGSVGLGYISSRVDNIWILDSGATSATHHPVLASSGSVANNIAVLSYGAPLGKLVRNDSLNNVYVGANLKYFDKAAAGTSDASNGNGKGLDMDLGAIYTPNNTVALGVNLQNILPASLGGVISYNSGIEEAIPAVAKIGANVSLTGAKEYAIFEAPIKMNLLADTDISIQQTKPSALHIGTEIWPNDNIALRLGYDIDPAPASVTAGENMNLTAGVGLKFAGFVFDYAYHPYSSNMADNATHFISISYIGKDPVEASKQPYLTLIKPKDKLITRKYNTTVSGMTNVDVKKVMINGAEVTLENKGGEETTFNTKMPLNEYGKILAVAEAYDKNGTLVQVEKRRIVHLYTFPDVKDGHWAKDHIEAGATVGLLKGWKDGNFYPNKNLNKQELNTLLNRIKDPASKEVFRSYIMARKKISRAECVAILLKTDYGKGKVDWLFNWDTGY